MRRAAAIFGAALTLGVAPTAALAQDCPKTTLGAVEKEVMCPVCGIPLELATEAPQANAERRFIQQQVDACRSKEEIKDALAAQFGPAVLSQPDDEGFDLAAYIVPIVAFLAATAGIALALVRWRRTRPPTPTTPAAEGSDLSPDDAARLEADMRKHGI